MDKAIGSIALTDAELAHLIYLDYVDIDRERPGLYVGQVWVVGQMVFDVVITDHHIVYSDGEMFSHRYTLRAVRK